VWLSTVGPGFPGGMIPGIFEVDKEALNMYNETLIATNKLILG